MYYQVVVRQPAGTWDYYPYWAPERDRHAATRLAAYAAQTGCEAAILQSVTAEMLQLIGRGVVNRQDSQLLPTHRFLPTARMAAPGHQWHGATMEFQAELQEATWEPGSGAANTIELDGRRLNIERGPGGDVTKLPSWQPLVSIPCRLDLLRSWMDMRRRLLRGLLGGPQDGAQTELRAPDGAMGA